MRFLAPVALLLALSMSLVTVPADHTQTEDGKTLTFDHKTGNEWWVEVTLSGSDATSVVHVEAQDTDGAWVDLDKKDWGAWAASFHIEPGNDVRFRATWSDGSQVVSCWFTHPAGEERCGEAESPPDDGFEATFDPVPGNKWWVETYVDAEREIASVDARSDGGPWTSLTKRSWGAWAASFYVEEGSVVQFRATSTDGAVSTSQGYLWPEAQPAQTLDAAFGPKAGNTWWVETYAIADSTITGVEARADDGEWRELTLRDWGTWAASFHVPAGSEVLFRATNETGAVDTSEAFLWPDAVPAADPDGEWPQEGSYAHYEEYGGGPTSEIFYERESTFVYHGGEWVVRCQGFSEQYGDREATLDFAENEPPLGPTDVVVGDRIMVPYGTCTGGSYDVIVEGQDTEKVHHEGHPATVDTWSASRTADCRCQGWEMEWETDTGLVVDAWRGGRTGDVDELQDTDAPIG